MLARDALAELSGSLGEARVLSVYLDGRVTDPAARLAWRSVLGNQLDLLKEAIGKRRRNELHELERCIDRLERALEPINGALRAPGFVAFVTEHRVELMEELPVVMPNVAMWELGPWVSPYIRAQKELRPVLLATVDARGARSYLYALGKLTLLERFHAHVHSDQPAHMGTAPRPFFHQGTRGAATTDAVVRAREHGTQRMLRELMDHITHAAPTDEWIVIGGAPARCEVVRAMLPPAARRRAAVAPGLGTATAAPTLRKAAADAARRLRQRMDEEIVESAIGHAAEHGRGSAGEARTKAALASKAVHMLLLSNRFTIDQPRDAEALARLALFAGANVEIVSGSAADRLDRVGGVAATLRFVAESGDSAPEPATEPALR